MTGKDFILKGLNGSDLSIAKRQQKQLDHFVISEVQEDISIEYINNWAQKKYVTNDYFLNFIKTVFKEENFLSFYKYLRYPLASSVILREEVIPELERVFHSDDAYSEYYVRGEKNKELKELNNQKFDRDLFQNLMYNHNSIIVTKLDEQGELKREFIAIDNVVAIDCGYNDVHKVAYKGTMPNELGQEVEGYIYVDNRVFEFYELEDKDMINEPLIVWEHNQENTPVCFTSPKPFYQKKKYAVRYSIFSSVRSDLEEYVFLKTIQRMTEPNGAIPIITKLKTNEVKKSGQKLDNEKTKDGLPLSSQILGGQQSEYNKEVLGGGGAMQAGTIYEIPAMKTDSGALDMDAVQNFIKFFYIPTEALEYLDNRVKEIERSIVRKVVGDYAEANESAKNEKQVEKSFVSKQDKLRNVSKWLSEVATKVDNYSISYLFGQGNYAVRFFGSDFFIETKDEIYEMIAKAPNPIEKRNLLKRLSGVNNKGNKENIQKDKIMYMLLPYATDTDFDKAVERGVVSNEIFELQTRFNYWLSLFEATYGSILLFWEGMGEAKEDEKLITINNLLIDLIINNTNTNNNE